MTLGEMKVPPAHHGVDQPSHLAEFVGLGHGAGIEVEEVGQFPLGRQLGAGGQRAAADIPL